VQAGLVAARRHLQLERFVGPEAVVLLPPRI